MALLIGLEIKHYIADYFLQPGWMLGGKGDFRKPGGYAHAGIHAAFSFVVLLVFGTPLWLAASCSWPSSSSTTRSTTPKSTIRWASHVDKDPRRFWALHGIDQLTHQLTYAAMIYVVLRGARASPEPRGYFFFLALAALSSGDCDSCARILSTMSRSSRRPAACCCRSTR